MRKLINKLRFLKFLKNSETDQILGIPSQILGNPSKIFHWNKAEMDLKFGKSIKKEELPLKIWLLVDFRKKSKKSWKCIKKWLIDRFPLILNQFPCWVVSMSPFLCCIIILKTEFKLIVNTRSNWTCSLASSATSLINN